MVYGVKINLWPAGQEWGERKAEQKRSGVETVSTGGAAKTPTPRGAPPIHRAPSFVGRWFDPHEAPTTENCLAGSCGCLERRPTDVIIHHQEEKPLPRFFFWLFSQLPAPSAPTGPILSGEPGFCTED